MKYVWVVEMKNWYNGKWEPCASCAITREEARPKLADWREHNPIDKFRLRKYASEAQP